MVTRAQWITIKPTTEQMRRAIREGNIRWDKGQALGSKSYGYGSREGNISGRLAEIVFGESYLGVEMPEDTDYLAAKRRGDDAAGWEVRSTRSRNGGMLLKPKDRQATYVQVVMSDAPNLVYITGWLTKAEAVEKLELVPMRDYPDFRIWDAPQAMLHPLPNIDGSFMRRHNALAA